MEFPTQETEQNGTWRWKNTLGNIKEHNETQYILRSYFSKKKILEKKCPAFEDWKPKSQEGGRLKEKAGRLIPPSEKEPKLWEKQKRMDQSILNTKLLKPKDSPKKLLSPISKVHFPKRSGQKSPISFNRGQMASENKVLRDKKQRRKTNTFLWGN